VAYIEWWNRTGPVTLGERFGLNEISIARNTLSPIKSHTAKEGWWFGTQGNYGAPEELSPMPNIPDLLREEGIKVGEQVKDGGRIGLKFGGSWADWKSNHSDQMTFEEYLKMDMPKPVHAIDKSTGGRIGFDVGGMAKLVEHVNTLKDGTVLTRAYITEYISKNNIKVNVENFFNRVFPSDKVKKTLKADTSTAARYTKEQLKNIEAYGKKKYDKLDKNEKFRVRTKGIEVGKIVETQKDKYKSAYTKAYKFYKDKGVKINDKVEEIIRKNISNNEGKFVEPKFSGLLYEGISSRLPDYTLEMLKKDLKAGKTSHQIAIEYFKANKKEVLKNFEGTKQFKRPLSALSTSIGNIINNDKELSKLYKKIIKDNSFNIVQGKAKYIKDIETLLPFIQEKGILVVDERGKAIKNAGDYFRYAYRTVSEPISKLFGYYETVGIEHPSGVARAVILEDANTLNRIIATIPETNTIKSKLDIHATGQAQFFKNIGDSKYIKNLNKITKKMNEEFATPRVVTDVKKGEAIVRPMKELSLTKPNLFQQTKGYIMQKLAAGGFNKSHFNKLAPELQKAIKAFEGGNLIKGNKYLKIAMLAAGLVLTTAGTTREKGMTTEEMEEKTSQFLEPVAKGLTYGAIGTIAANYPKELWEGIKKVGKYGIVRPIAAATLPIVKGVESAVETVKAVKEKRLPDYDLTSPETWVNAAFWNWAVKEWGFDKTVDKFGQSLKHLSTGDKARVFRNVVARAGLSPKALQFIGSRVAWPVAGIMSVYDAYKDYKRTDAAIKKRWEDDPEGMKKQAMEDAEIVKGDTSEMFAQGGIASLMK